MKKLFQALVVASLMLVAGCRQPDGPMPQPTPEEQNEIGDLSRDFLSIAGGDEKAVQDAADDMGGLGPHERGRRFAPEMSKRFARVLTGKTLTDQQALALATQMYLTFAATELSSRQIEKIQEDVRTQLTALGVAADAIDPITRQIEATQAEVTTAERRWWQVI